AARSSIESPRLRTAEIVTAVSVLLWHETQPDFLRKTESDFCSSGRLLVTASLADAAGLGLTVSSLNGVASFAPALASRSTTGVEPLSLAKSIADLPWAFLAFTSAPRAIRVLTASIGNESELAASIRSVFPP